MIGKGDKLDNIQDWNAKLEENTSVFEGTQRRLDSRSQSIMGNERLITRAASFTL